MGEEFAGEPRCFDRAIGAGGPFFDPGGRCDSMVEDDDPAPARAAAVAPPEPRVAAPDAAALAALIRRIADHDEAALADFYDATIGRVYGIVLRIVRDAMAAEDIAEEVFYTVWRQAARYDPARGQPLGWLLMMARSRALDHLRARDAAICHPEPTLLLEAEPELETDVGQAIDAARRGDRLRAALARLEPVPRQMVALAFFRGLTHEEIATHANLPLGTVKSHIRRALASLREWLAPEPEGSTGTS